MVPEIAQKAIERCHCHMMAYAFDFELAQNSDHSVYENDLSTYTVFVKSGHWQSPLLVIPLDNFSKIVQDPI